MKTTWQPAGVWFLAGSNSCVFADAATETGIATPRIITSNRRFRDDEFMIGPTLTRGRSELRLRFVYESATVATLGADLPVPAQGWSEMRYTAYSIVVPAWR